MIQPPVTPPVPSLNITPFLNHPAQIQYLMERSCNYFCEGLQNQRLTFGIIHHANAHCSRKLCPVTLMSEVCCLDFLLFSSTCNLRIIDIFVVLHVLRLRWHCMCSTLYPCAFHKMPVPW